MKLQRILLVENDLLLPPILNVARTALPDMAVETSPSTELARNHIRTMEYSVIITPLMTAKIDGLTILREATQLHPRTPVI